MSEFVSALDLVSDIGQIFKPPRRVEVSKAAEQAVVISTPMVGHTDIQPGDTVIVHHNVFRRWHNQYGIEKNSRSYFNEDTYLINDSAAIFLSDRGCRSRRLRRRGCQTTILNRARSNRNPQYRWGRRSGKKSMSRAGTTSPGTTNRLQGWYHH